jgi:CubicO group peptidase (beta-lactamase class C family)
MSNPETTPFDQLALFSGAPQHDNFHRFKDLVPTRKMDASKKPFAFPKGDVMVLPSDYEFDGKTKSTEAFFTETDTTALLVLKDGAVRYERYALTSGADVHWISWSVSKSFVSALVGIAVKEGHIRSIEDAISEYVPVPPGSAYFGVTIKQVLQMSSGARWNEDYSDPNCDIFRLAAAMGGAMSLEEFVAGMVPECKPGTVCRYNSGETQALGSLLVHATKRSLSDYMQEKLFEPLGMNMPGYWLIDKTGMEMAFAGLNLVARDFIKLGQLYLNKGVWEGKQVVPAAWVQASVTPDAPHLMPGNPLLNDHALPFGYGYQWWIPDDQCGEFAAIGIYNQIVYVDRSRGVVIYKQSSNRTYGTSKDEATNREVESIEFLRAIAREFDRA